MIREIQIMGLQRSGTNWMEALLGENFVERVHGGDLTFAWKHGSPSEYHMANRGIFKSVRNWPDKLRHPWLLVCVMYKPFDLWLASIEKSPVDLKKPYARPELFTADGIDEEAAHALHTRYYAEWDYAAAESENVRIIDYGEALMDTDGLLCDLADRYGLTPKADEWQIEGVGPRFSDERRKYYEEAYSCMQA